jgi:hypothetical protein
VVTHARQAAERAVPLVLALVAAICLVIDGGAKRW